MRTWHVVYQYHATILLDINEDCNYVSCAAGDGTAGVELCRTVEAHDLRSVHSSDTEVSVSMIGFGM